MSFLWLSILQQYVISWLHKPVARYGIEGGGVFPTKVDFLCACWEKLDFMRILWEKMHLFACIIGEMDFFAHSPPHCQGHILWENFLKNIIEKYAFTDIMT